MKHIKKIAALVLAFAMILSLSSVAFAADTTGDVYTDDSKTNTTDNKIPIVKSIVFFNQNGSSVYEPNITYTYEVTPVTVANSTVTDDGEFNNDDPVTVRVNSGIANSVGSANIVFSSSNDVVANVIATGTEVEKSADLTVDLSKFEHAGIYRYLVTETQNPNDITEKGLEARTSDYSNERYLDVYISNERTGSGTTTDPYVYTGNLVLSGAVFFKTNAKDESSTPNNATDAITTTTEKTTGFEPGTNTPDSSTGKIDYTNDKTVDRYTTYDIEVKKVITGGMADKTHEFPFYINITNSIAGAKYTYVDDPGTGAGAAEEIISAATITKGTDEKTSALKLKDGESVKFVGVPSNQTNALTIAVKEFNDTVDYYSAAAAVVNGTAPTVKMDNDDHATQMKASDGYAVLTPFDVKANDAKVQVITVTNNLAEISPTGYVVRIAPYVLMLAGGIALLIVTRRRRREDSQAA